MVQILDSATGRFSGLSRPLLARMHSKCQLNSEKRVCLLLRKNPAYKPLAEDMHISITTASYNTTICIVFAGITPLILSPISAVYGRRPIYIFVSIIGIIAGAGSAIATSYGSLLVARAFLGIGTSAGMGIGASAVSDMYFMHERGK